MKKKESSRKLATSLTAPANKLINLNEQDPPDGGTYKALRGSRRSKHGSAVERAGDKPYYMNRTGGMGEKKGKKGGNGNHARKKDRRAGFKESWYVLPYLINITREKLGFRKQLRQNQQQRNRT